MQEKNETVTLSFEPIRQAGYVLVAAAAVVTLLSWPARADVVHNDDVIVEGRLCASDGDACADGESFLKPGPGGPDVEILIKDNHPNLYFEDTDADESDWLITLDAPINEGFTIHNEEANTNPFNIENGAGSNLLYLDSLERIGINTSTPAFTVDVVGDRIRLQSPGGARSIQMRVDGFATDIEAVGGDLFLRSSSNANIVMNPFSGDGNVAIGPTAPQRQLHLSGSDAVFRMDRTTDTAAFLLVRTTGAGSPLKSFVVGTNASGANTGEFIINDLGTAVGGPGTRRLTIDNTGDAIFTGNVQAPAFVTTSSRRFKENVERLSDALAVTQQLRGVRFNWKDTGRPALGLIAEEVAPVLPEVVERDAEDGQLVGVNYPALVAVLVEAVKEQQRQMEAQDAKALAQQAELASLKVQVAEFEIMKARLTEIEGLVAGGRLQVTVHTLDKYSKKHENTNPC